MSNFISTGSDKQIPDHLFYIPVLFCSSCNDWRDFHLDDGKPHCVCCHEELIATKEDIAKVANRSPRAGVKRFSGLIGVSDLEHSL